MSYFIYQQYQNSVIELHGCGIFKEIFEGGGESQ